MDSDELEAQHIARRFAELQERNRRLNRRLWAATLALCGFLFGTFLAGPVLSSVGRAPASLERSSP